MSLKVRQATLQDSEVYLRMCREFYEASPFYPTVPYSQTAVQTILAQSVKLNSPYVVLVLQDENQVLGMLVGCATKTPFSDDWLAAELAWWVDPHARGSRMALQLVEAYEAWALAKGCTHVSMSLLTTLADASKLYERLGYKKTEISFLKELD